MRVRVANIYGPGRLPIAHLKAGHPLLREDQAPATSRVHSDDLARALGAVAAAGRGGQVFNVSDAEPCSMTKFFKEVARLTGIPVPEEVDLERAREVMKPLLLNYFTESRILNSDKIVNELGVQWQYPSLREGLPASI
jgi:nucleoside-diphosphate-sugar epimerase